MFSAIDVLVAMINASTNDSSAVGSHAASFASVWTLFMVVAVSVTGTVILKKVRIFSSTRVLACFVCFLRLCFQLSQSFSASTVCLCACVVVTLLNRKDDVGLRVGSGACLRVFFGSIDRADRLGNERRQSLGAVERRTLF